MIDLRSRELSLAGIKIDALERGDLIDLLSWAKSCNEKLVILHHNLHSLHQHVTDPQVRAAYSKASYVYVDGMPVVWCAQLAGLPVERKHRITFLDCFDSILEDAVRHRWRVFYLGSAPEVLSSGIETLKDRFPELVIEGHHGFFGKSGQESDDVVAKINHFAPDILFVGMGMPIQEIWLEEHYPKLLASAIMTSGATLDYVTGRAYRPPAWVGPLGLYGIFRLCSDPKRLWRRYLVEPIVLARHLALPLIRQRLRKQMQVREAS